MKFKAFFPAFLLCVLVPVADAQGVFAKAIEKAQRTADQESYGGEINLPDGLARFFATTLSAAGTSEPPPLVMPSGVVKLAEPLIASGKRESADALASQLKKLLADALPPAAQALQGASASIATNELASLRASQNALTDGLRKSSESKLREELRPLVRQAAESAGLDATWTTFLTAADAKLANPKAALSAVEDQIADQALEHVFKVLARQERIYRAHPEQAEDKIVTAAFRTLK